MRLAGVAAALAALASGSTVARAQARSDSASAFDVLHYDVRLTLPDSGTRIEETTAITVRRTAETTLALDLVGLTVGTVQVNGAAAPFARDSATLRVTLPPARGLPDTLTVTVTVSGSPTDALVAARDSLGGWSAFADNWPDRARHWIPSVDHPDDKATVTWTVNAPRDREVIANGELVSQELVSTMTPGPAKPTSTTVWRETHPIPTYLMVVAVSRVAHRTLVSCAPNEAGCLPQAVIFAPEVAGFLPGPFARAPEMVSYFTSLVGPFPYEKLWHVQSSTQFGGMENASAIFYADQPFRDRTMTDGVIAHETAHQWFGDAVTERTFGDLWLSEGFATYFAALWTAHARGDSAFRAEMAAARTKVVASKASAGRPVRDTTERQYMRLLNTNSYEKGAWVLHMLRGEIGDSAFFRGVRAYYAAHRDGNATTADLRAAMETASTRDLGWFFEQWLTRAGTPAVEIRRVGGPGGVDATFELTQRSDRPYRFPLTVRERETGRRVTVQVPAQRVVRLTLPARGFDLDPDVGLLAKMVVGGTP